MILFLNFAPIDFFGGAERWAWNTASELFGKEETMLVHAARPWVNAYGRLVLHRPFNKRINLADSGRVPLVVGIRLRDCIPGTTGWRRIRNYFANARLIYARFELPEITLLLWFGGGKSLTKTIAGIHSPLVYQHPSGFFDRLHKFVYESSFSRSLLEKMKTVHVLARNDEKLLRETFSLSNVINVPNGVSFPDAVLERNNDSRKKELNILFVGELSARKGIGTFLSLIRSAPPYFRFTIVGDGPFRQQVEALSKDNTNLSYRGYLNKNELNSLYAKQDVLILPSDAEGMPLVILEALSYGLTIVDTDSISLGLPSGIEYSVKRNDRNGYMRVLEKLYHRKQGKGLKKRMVQNYCRKYFQIKKIQNDLYGRVFCN